MVLVSATLLFVDGTLHVTLSSILIDGVSLRHSLIRHSDSSGNVINSTHAHAPP